MPQRAINVERLLPSLLDRLTDRYPKATRERHEDTVVSVSQYRNAVRRDLLWLLNTSVSLAPADLEQFECVSTSTLAFGLRRLSDTWVSQQTAEDIQHLVREAILRFEPRILPASLSVSLVEDAETSAPHAIRLEISGELWMQPVPEPLYIRTEIDLETGGCRMTR